MLPAISYFARRLKEELPLSRIVFIGNCDIKKEITDAMKCITEHYGIEYVALSNVVKVNGHPDEVGMEQIFDQMLTALKTSQKNTIDY